MVLARNAQRQYDLRKQEERDYQERERLAWDDTLEQIRHNFNQAYEFRFATELRRMPPRLPAYIGLRAGLWSLLGLRWRFHALALSGHFGG